MRVYPDTCALMRMFDEQTQPRVRKETEAMAVVMRCIQQGRWDWVANERLLLELLACKVEERRKEAVKRLSFVSEWHVTTPAVFGLVASYQRQGLGFHDTEHLATAEASGCDVFLTTDDALLKRGRLLQPTLTVRLVYPFEALEEEQSDG